MDALFMVVGALVGIGGGAALGMWIGKLISSRPQWWFWLLSVVMLSLGMGVAFLGLQIDTDAVFVAGVGLIGGGLTGLKYGARRVPGFGSTEA